MIGTLLEAEPHLAADVVFGIRAAGLLDTRLDEHLLSSWSAGRSSLLAPSDRHAGAVRALRWVPSQRG